MSDLQTTHFSWVRFLGDGRWDVECSACDFTVRNLSSFEAAEDTANWHEGKPSYIGEFAAGASTSSGLTEPVGGFDTETETT